MSNPHNANRLSGHVALVTGGGRGLGRAIAKELARQGAQVCITGQAEAALKATVDDINATGGTATYAVCDVTDTSAMTAVVEGFKKDIGAVSILVNNAGIADGGPFEEADTEAWWRVMEVNVKGPMILSRLVLPDMISAGRGQIINIGSYAAIGPSPYGSPYSTSKTALLRLTDSVAAEVRDKGVNVIAVSPGFVRTDMGTGYEQAMTAINPAWEGIDPEFIFGPEAIAAYVCDIASGKADVFSGRLLHVKDRLDDLLEKADEILADDRLGLRFRM